MIGRQVLRTSTVLMVVMLSAMWADCAHAFLGKVGSEFQVNTTTTGYQYYPRVATDPTGGFLIVWDNTPVSESDVAGQRYDSTGAKVGTEFIVNAQTTGSQQSPVVAYSSTGAYIAFWGDGRAGGSDYDIYGNVIIGTGPFFPSDTRVNTYTTGFQLAPSVATFADGSAVIAWQSADQDGSGKGVFAQRRSSLGAPLGTEFQVNTYTTGNQSYPSVATQAGGGFVVVWMGQNSNSFGRTYDSSGAPLGSEFQLNSNPSLAFLPVVAADDSGGFVAAWRGFDSPSEPIFARRFDSAGTPVGTEVSISNEDSDSPAIAHEPASGGFVVVWQGYADDTNYDDIFARRLDAAGTPIGTEFPVNTNRVGYQRNPTVAADGTGGLVVAWHGPDADKIGVFAQRFGDVSDLCPDTPAAGCRTAGKSILLIKDSNDDTKDKLIWKWIRGASTTAAEFGDPTTSRNYALCVYDSGGRLISADVPPSATKWQDLKYKDSSGSADGVQKIILKPSATSNAKVLVKGKGTNLPDTTLGALSLPVTAQFINDESSVCFEAVYDTGDVIKNDTTQFKAKKQS
jgi:hypothetical protein